MMRRVILAVSLCLGGVYAVSVNAQATAHQGGNDVAGTTRFTSPMVIETPFHAADPETWGKGDIRGADRLAQFVCEGVFIRDFAVATKKERGGRNARISFYLMLANEPGVDMLAMPVVEIVRGDRVLTRTAFGTMDVEEGKIASRRISIVVPVSGLTEGEAPHLRITISTKRNG